MLGHPVSLTCIQYPMFYRIDIENQCPKVFFFRCSFPDWNLTHKSRPLVAFFLMAFEWPFRPCNGLRTAVEATGKKALLEGEEAASVASSPAFQRGNCRRSALKNGRQLRFFPKLLVGPL